MLLLHGSGMSSSTWRHNIEPLSEYFSVYALDFPGFDDPAQHFLPDHILEESAERVYGVISALAIDRAHLVGNSIGGSIAALVTLQRPEKVHRLVLIGAVGLREAPYFEAKNTGHQTNSLAEMIALSGQSPEVPLKAARLFDPQMLQELEKQSLVGRPVLIITGENDPFIHREAVCYIAARNPVAKCVIIPEAGHLPHEEQPEVVNRQIISYCIEVPVSTFCG
ncbi:MAG: alpha/beta hydrolase, partial [Bacteroidota bacterium]